MMNRVYVATGFDGSQRLLTARQAREIMAADVPAEMAARKLLNLDVYASDGVKLDWLVKGEVAHAY